MSAISDGLQFGAATVAVLGAGGTAYKYGVRRWRQTIGRRRAQSAILDQLCCTSSMAFVESKLGVPHSSHTPTATSNVSTACRARG